MRRRLRALLPGLVAIAAVIGLVGVVLLLLGPVAWLVAGSTVRGIPDLKNRADAVNTVRNSLLTATAGIIAAVALYFTARNYYLSRRGQVTDRFTKAIALLASDKAAERVGGIYALEHVLRESSVDHSTVVDVLAAYIRDRAPAQQEAPPARLPIPTPGLPQLVIADPAPERHRPAADVQAALTVLARRPDRPEATLIDLRQTDLRGAELGSARLPNALLTQSQLQGADLSGARLQGANLAAAQMQGANLGGAQLQHADLGGAQLQGANLVEGKLQAAYLVQAQLQRANLARAKLQGAHLGGAQLQHATLVQAKLNGAHLVDVHLQAARLVEAQLQGPPVEVQLQSGRLVQAQLQDAHLDGADLWGITGLNQEMLQSAVWGRRPPVVNSGFRSWLERPGPKDGT